MMVTAYDYKALEELREKRDEINIQLSEAIERNESPQRKQNLERQLETLLDHIDRVEIHVARRVRNVGLGIPEYHYSNLERLQQKLDTLNLQLSEAIEKDESPKRRRELEKELEPLLEQINRLETYLANRERNIQLGRAI